MKTESTILACTDGSIYAQSVYDHAAWAAGRLEATIHVLHIIDPVNESTALHNFSGTIGLDSRQKLKAELVQLEELRGRAAQTKAAAILESAREYFRTKGIENFSADAIHGHLAESVEQYESQVDLLVIGKRGESADFQRQHLGANLERVIRTCHHPVWVASRAFKPIQRLLIAYDGGPSARKAVEYAATSPLLRGLECHILTVGSPHGKIDDDITAAHQRLAEAGYSVQHHRVNGHPEEVFSRFIADHKIDLLVMGAYGHSRIRQMIVGSTTTAMVRTCHIPVLMFR